MSETQKHIKTENTIRNCINFKYYTTHTNLDLKEFSSAATGGRWLLVVLTLVEEGRSDYGRRTDADRGGPCELQ
jgi:hypothetical protein